VLIDMVEILYALSE